MKIHGVSEPYTGRRGETFENGSGAGRPQSFERNGYCQSVFQYVEGVRQDVNIAVVTNLIKIYVLAAEGREMLHKAGYEETMERMRDSIIYEIFGRTD